MSGDATQKAILHGLGIEIEMPTTAADLADILAARSEFKEISVAKEELSSLPAGKIIVFGKDPKWTFGMGHSLITLGDNRAVSDYLEYNTPTHLAENDVPYRVFEPVEVNTNA